ncbi:MAG: response regulator [Desulfuromonadales bacterium]
MAMAKQQEARGGEGAKILIVDDDPLILRLIDRLLGRENFSVLCAETGEAGLDLLRREPEVGVVVSDLVMPGMNGIDFLEQARMLQPLAVRIILSGQGDLETTIEAINRGGASLYVTKPFEGQHLILTLREAVGNFNLRRENQRLVATVNRQNEELKQWNLHLQQRADEQTAQIREQNALLRAHSDSLQKITDQLHTIFNGIPDSLLLLSTDLEIVLANPGAAGRFGRPVEALIGEHCYRLVCGRDERCHDCPAVRTLADGRTEDGTVDAPDGRTWGIKVFPLKDRQGRIVGLIEWASDISEKILLREEARQASRLAALGEMAAGVAHEINNPTAVILLNLPILRDVFADVLPLLEGRAASLAGIPFEEMRRELPVVLADCQASAGRIKRIVEDLKDFLRSEKEGFSELVDLREVAEAAARLAGSSIRAATDRFRSDHAPSLPKVKGSFRRLEQVMISLLMNACQALPDCSREIVLATRFDADRRLCIVEVRDQGTGISPENLGRVREPFFTTRREEGGTGLGLSVSNRIVKAHGGCLDLVSSPGAGTVAMLRLPPADGEFA